jgi:hypothetical protein
VYPRAKLHLARGLCVPSGGFPPRSRAMRTLGRNSASLEARAGPPPRARDAAPTPPDQSIKCSDTPRVPRSKVNSRHAGPLTTLGNHISALFRQPSSRGHLHHFAALCGKASVNSVTLCHPLPHGRCAAPSKEDNGTLEKGTDIYPAPTRDNTVTSSQWSVSPPSPSALCSHP